MAFDFIMYVNFCVNSFSSSNYCKFWCAYEPHSTVEEQIRVKERYRRYDEETVYVYDRVKINETVTEIIPIVNECIGGRNVAKIVARHCR